MSLTGKLLGGFGAMLALLLLLFGGTLMAMRDLNVDLDRAANVLARRLYLAGNINAAASSMASCERAAVLDAVLGKNASAGDFQGQFQEVANDLRKSLRGLHRIADTQEAVARLERLDGQASAAIDLDDEFRREVKAGETDRALTTFRQKLQPQLEEIGRQASSLVDQQNRDLSVASAASAAKWARARWAAAGMAWIALALGCGLFLLVRQASFSLKGLTARMSENVEEVA